MSSEGGGGAASAAAGLSATIEEDGIYDCASAVAVDSGSVSQTPTDSSRRSSQLSLPVSEAADVALAEAPSTAPKQPRRGTGQSSSSSGTNAANGVRQMLEKRRKATSGASRGGEAPHGGGGGGERSAEKRSIFTLDHVKRMFGPQQDPEQQQRQQLQQQRRRASGGAGEELELRQRLSRLSVDSLPAVFLAKCLGEAPAAGLFGVDCVREPVAALVKAAGKRKAKSGRPLPIAQLTVLPQGVSVRPHPQSEGGQVARSFHAMESVSYAVVDPGVERIFCLVTVEPPPPPPAQADSPDTVRPVCRAFLCNSPDTAHRLVLAVTLAFECSAKSQRTGGADGSATQREFDHV